MAAITCFSREGWGGRAAAAQQTVDLQLCHANVAMQVCVCVFMRVCSQSRVCKSIKGDFPAFCFHTRVQNYDENAKTKIQAFLFPQDLEKEQIHKVGTSRSAGETMFRAAAAQTEVTS